MIPVNNTNKISSNAVNPELWVETYRNSLFKYALSRLRDADLAEEKIQETFLAALQSRKHFQGLDHFRRISRDRQLHVAFPMESISYDVSDSKRIPAVRSSFWVFDPSKAYDEKEFLKIIKQALSELPRRLAQVFILHEVIELSSQEICEFMDISTCNLYVMMHRARKRLRCYLQLYK
jgi:RNA polymerase sigma-70 factor (ECF subfamily)